MATSIGNVFKNMVAPVSRNSTVLAGFSIDVLLETTISWVLRWLVGARHGFFKILFTVALAAPLIGVGSFIPATIKSGKNLKTSGYGFRFMLGLQSVPSIFLSQYIVGTAQNAGFYNPGFDIWHILITIFARTISRVIILLLNEYGMWGMGKWEQYVELQQRQIRTKY
jgi:hypothetical protein